MESVEYFKWTLEITKNLWNIKDLENKNPKKGCDFCVNEKTRIKVYIVKTYM